MLHASATDDAFAADELNFDDGVVKASDDDRARFETTMREVTKNNKYKLDNGISTPLGQISGQKLYKGMVYIPMSSSTISALASTGYKAAPEMYN
jgi:hypothetical protein